MNYREPVTVCRVGEDGSRTETRSTLGRAVGEIARWIRQNPGEPSPSFLRYRGRILFPGDILALAEQPGFPTEYR
jgi:hypothetical protein